MQTLGGSDTDFAGNMALSGNTLFVSATAYSSDFQIGGAGPMVDAEVSDAFVVALDAATGAARTTFGVASGVLELAMGERVSSGLRVPG